MNKCALCLPDWHCLNQFYIFSLFVPARLALSESVNLSLCIYSNATFKQYGHYKLCQISYDGIVDNRYWVNDIMNYNDLLRSVLPQPGRADTLVMSEILSIVMDFYAITCHPITLACLTSCYYGCPKYLWSDHILTKWKCSTWYKTFVTGYKNMIRINTNNSLGCLVVLSWVIIYMLISY